MKRLNKNIITNIFLISSDILSFILSIYLARSIYADHIIPRNIQPISDWMRLHVFLAISCICWFGIFLRHYGYRKNFWIELKEIITTLAIFAILEFAIIAFTHWFLPRHVLGATWIILFILLSLLRVMNKLLLNKIGLWQRDAVIIGCGLNAIETYRALASDKYLGFNILYFIGQPDDKHQPQQIEGIPVIYQDTSWLSPQVDKQLQFLVAVENEQNSICHSWLRELLFQGYSYVSVIPGLRGVPLDNTDMSFIFSKDLMFFRMNQGLGKRFSRFIKRIFDLVVASLAILFLSPLLLFIFFKVRADGGPAIYGHERIGSDGMPFNCLKFRSMSVNSQQILAELLANDPCAREEWNNTFKLKNDPRITKIGHVLRRTSFDELPQLFNVLKGDMSLVGPRPIILEELQRYNEQANYYLMSKPGMTGLWQVSGRSDVDYDARVYFDSWYVKNWSMWNDITILAKTVMVVLRRDGAY